MGSAFTSPGTSGFAAFFFARFPSNAGGQDGICRVPCVGRVSRTQPAFRLSFWGVPCDGSPSRPFSSELESEFTGSDTGGFAVQTAGLPSQQRGRSRRQFVHRFASTGRNHSTTSPHPTWLDHMRPARHHASPVEDTARPALPLLSEHPTWLDHMRLITPRTPDGLYARASFHHRWQDAGRGEIVPGAERPLYNRHNQTPPPDDPLVGQDRYPPAKRIL